MVHDLNISSSSKYIYKTSYNASEALIILQNIMRKTALSDIEMHVLYVF